LKMPRPSYLMGVCPNPTAALLMQHIIYCARYAKKGRGGHRWFVSSYTDWAANTGLSFDQVKRSLAALRKAGLIVTEQHLSYGRNVSHVRLTHGGEGGSGLPERCEDAPPERCKNGLLKEEDQKKDQKKNQIVRDSKAGDQMEIETPWMKGKAQKVAGVTKTHNEKVKKRLDELIAIGEQVLATKRNPGQNVIGDSRVDTQMASQWATSAQNLLVRVFGKESEHYKNFSAQFTKNLTFSPTYRAQGILKAAKDDYENEQLSEIRRLIEAELFDDFLEQSEHLLNSGYYQPAAVIAGCVLEDGLRKLCEKESIALPSKPKLDAMNSDLAKAGVFSKLVQERITAIADLRNKAAHGQWDQFTNDDVVEMIQAVRRIMEEHFP